MKQEIALSSIIAGEWGKGVGDTITLLTAEGEKQLTVCTTDDLKRQFAFRMLSVLAVGIVLGTTLAGTLGEKIAAMAISSFGAAAFRFEVNLPVTFILCPVVLLLGAMVAVMIGTNKIGQISISKAMKE